MSLWAGAADTSPERRYACDGLLYSLDEFSAFYTADEAAFMWHCALPENLDLATKKMRTVVETYENLAWRLARREGETVLPPAVPMSAFADRPLGFWRHYDFVEVGTSDWGTITQFCAGQQNDTYVSWVANFIRTSIDGLRWVRGLAVEPMKEYLDALPDLPRVTKVEAAMAEASRDESMLFFVSPANIDCYWGKLKAPVTPPTSTDAPWEVDVMWYAKSMSSLGRPQPELLEMLDKVGHPELLEQRVVQVLSWGDLCYRYGIGSVDVVQLDCEGMDCGIIKGMLNHFDETGDGLPRLICFEANHLTPDCVINQTLQSLEQHGYSVRWRSYSNIIVERA